MIPNSYNSFEEIDNQLKILSLQKQIYKERIKLSLKNSKLSLNANSIKNELKGLLQQQIYAFATRILFKKLREKKEI